MKKALPITLILLGATLLITAVVFWIDSSTSAEPQSFGKTLLDWVTLIAGLGASIKGWIDLFKPDKPTSPSTKIDVKGDRSQISLGDNSPNIQTETYIGTQIVQQPSEPKTPKSLNQLLAPPLDFVGREKELAQLHQNIEKGVVISGVQGMGGIGKTALGLKLAEQIAPNFPDGQIYLDLRGAHKQTPLTPEQVMVHVIRSYHPEAELPLDFGELGAMYRSVLNDKKVLLFYDNARDEKQLDSLLPPKSCTLLVTSRQYFTLPGLEAIDLETLAPKDAIELVQEISSRVNDRDAETLAKQCGYLPLAIRASVNVLQLRPDWSPAELIKLLGDNRARLGLVESSLGLSYDALDTDLQKYLRQLGVFAAPFDKEAILAIWEIKPQLLLTSSFENQDTQSEKLPAERADEILGNLLKTSLLKYNSTTNEYYFHDLAHLFLEEKLQQDENADEVLWRYAEHCLKIASQAESEYLRGGKFIPLSLLRFRHIWVHLNTVSERLSSDSEAKWRKPVKAESWLANATPRIFYSLYASVPSKEYLPLGERGLNAARLSNNRSSEAWHLSWIAWSYYLLGDTHQAIDYCVKALSIYNDIGDKVGIFMPLGNLGSMYAVLGNAGKAIEYFKETLNIAREIGSKRNEGTILGNLGTAYAMLGEKKKSKECYEQALAIAQEIGDHQTESQILGSIGFRMENFSAQGAGLEIAKKIGDKRTEAYLICGVASKKRLEGNLEESLKLFGDALRISDEVGDSYAKSQILDNMANTYADLGKYEEAIENYLHALQLANDVDDEELVANISWNLATVYNEQGNFKLAAKYMQIMVDFEQKINHPNASTDLKSLNEVCAKTEKSLKPEENS